MASLVLRGQECLRMTQALQHLFFGRARLTTALDANVGRLAVDASLEIFLQVYVAERHASPPG